MSRRLSLSAVATVTLDGNGAGIAAVGPASTREIWSPGTASVSVSSNASEATCQIFAGNAASAAYFVDGTTWGSTGDSTSDFNIQIYPGQSVFARWTGGDAHATATLVVTGTRTVP